MILTKNSLRDIKTALMAIPGHPGSSRISEALARGFRYDDNHALKNALEAHEIALGEQPIDLDFDSAGFIEALGSYDNRVAADMAATAQYLVNGDLFIEDHTSYPELAGAEVILQGFVQKPWADAASSYLGRMNAALGKRTWVLFIAPHMWDTPNDVEELGTELNYFIEAASNGYEDISEQDYDTIQDFDEVEETGLFSFLDATFLRFRHMIPAHSRRTARHLAVDGKGVRFIHFDNGHAVEVWLVSRDVGAAV